jgi:chemotaxis protein MotB
MLHESKNEALILIKRRRQRHGIHHGGAWKVAYADFVTALMSLFIVLWLTSTSDTVKRSIAKYFNDPLGTSTLQGTNRNGAGHALPIGKDEMSKLKERLLAAAQQMPNFDKLKNQVEITAEQDGLRIELLEQPGGTFFESGSAQPTPALHDFLMAISPELGRMGNRISIEGHTDSVPYSEDSSYTNWELSADRANAARRLMQASGIAPGQVAEVRGFADQLPRRPDAPEDPSNRRITLIIQPSSAPLAGSDRHAIGREMRAGPDKAND